MMRVVPLLLYNIFLLQSWDMCDLNVLGYCARHVRNMQEFLDPPLYKWEGLVR